MGGRARIFIGIGVIVVGVVVLAVLAVSALNSGDDDTTAGNGTTATAEKPAAKSTSGATGDAGADAGSSSGEPALQTVAIKREEGDNASANVGALIRSPGEIWIRVSAAPKQEVTVNWTLACGTGATSQGSYDATPPDTRQLKLPKRNPKTCVASASSQIDGDGRLKIAVMRDR